MKRTRKTLRSVVLRRSAGLWRLLLPRVTVVAVTGSVGKTTTKECLAAILARRAPTSGTLYSGNHGDSLHRTLLRVRWRHRFVVVEVGAVRPGAMRRSARTVRADIALVLSVARTHTDVFDTLEATATEKRVLVEHLEPEGTAVLNADDPRVAAMAAACRGTVVTFGCSRTADVRADTVSAIWPERLSFRVHSSAGSRLVQTQLVGAHWLHATLAAISAALVCGASLDDAVAALATVEPFPGRMQPLALPSGAVLLRDEFNGSPETWAAALDFLDTARAHRRVVVAGDHSDSRERPRKRLRTLGARIARVAEAAVFVGAGGRHAVDGAVAAGMPADAARSFATLEAASEYLRSELREGDLALLKGRTGEHFSRIAFAQFGRVGCRKTKCARMIVCDHCPELCPAETVVKNCLTWQPFAREVDAPH